MFRKYIKSEREGEQRMIGYSAKRIREKISEKYKNENYT